MNLEQEMQEQGFDAQEDVSGTELQVLSSKIKFTGIIDPAPPIDPNLPLDSDLREKSILSINAADEPGLVYGDILTPTDPTNHNPVSYKVLEREENPADFVIKYWLIKIVAGKDT